MVSERLCAHLLILPSGQNPSSDLVRFSCATLLFAEVHVARARTPQIQCWCPLLGGVAGFSSARAADVSCASGFAGGFSHSHDLGFCSCEVLPLLCAALPSSIAGIMAAMQPERSSAQVSAPTGRNSLCIFMVGMGCYWVRDFIEFIFGFVAAHHESEKPSSRLTSRAC